MDILTEAGTIVERAFAATRACLWQTWVYGGCTIQEMHLPAYYGGEPVVPTAETPANAWARAWPCPVCGLPQWIDGEADPGAGQGLDCVWCSRAGDG